MVTHCKYFNKYPLNQESTKIPTKPKIEDFSIDDFPFTLFAPQMNSTFSGTLVHVVLIGAKSTESKQMSSQILVVF